MKHTLTQDKNAIQYHYDVSNDFYRLFLDKNMVYSCAYYKQKSEDLDTAQANKLDYICRKLRLKAGDNLLDIGCGWGGLLVHAVKYYNVKGTGITLSSKQYEYARNWVKKEELASSCQIKLQDYRELSGEKTYDKIVSVGMVEHVGLKNLPVYFKTIKRLLKDNGLFLNHGITTAKTNKRKTGAGQFIDTYVFPDGELTNISQMQKISEETGFEVLDVESLRSHYAQTLKHWTNRLMQQANQALQLVNNKTYRIWVIYMAGCTNAFEKGDINVYQTLLAKNSSGLSPVPLTRADLYLA